MFFGTPQSAVPVLEALTRSSHRVISVVTAPDRPGGRGLKLQPSPVKLAAARSGIPVLQPVSLRSAEGRAPLEQVQADVFAVAAFGLILPQQALDIAPLGCINVHFSVLPELRGAAPVQRAIAQGRAATGVSIMRMDAGLDTGPILKIVEEAIGPQDTGGLLTERLAGIGAGALVEVLDGLEQIEAVAQPDQGATYAAKVTTEEAHIDWDLPARTIVNRIRAFNPRPGAWGMLGSKRLKVLASRAGSGSSGHAPGTLVVEADGAIGVQTGSGLVELEVVQPEGRSPMPARAFSRGNRPATGDRMT